MEVAESIGCAGISDLIEQIGRRNLVLSPPVEDEASDRTEVMEGFVDKSERKPKTLITNSGRLDRIERMLEHLIQLNIYDQQQ